MPVDVATFNTLRTSNFVNPAADVAALFDWLEIKLDDFKAWTLRNQALLGIAVVADPPQAPKLDQMRLVHLDGSPLVEKDWARLHRLIRLAKRTGLDVATLGTLLAAVHGADPMAVGALVKLSGLVALQGQLSLDWPTAVAMVDSIGAGGANSLYTKLFLRSGIANADQSFFRRLMADS